MDDINKKLFEAATKGWHKKITQYLKLGAFIDSQDNFYQKSALMGSIINDKDQCFNALIAAGANANLQNSGGETALFYATHSGVFYLNAMKALISRGADINHISVSRNKSLGITDRRTPLMLCAQRANIQGVELLLSHGADPTIKNNYDETVLDIADRSYSKEIASIMRTTIETSTLKQENTSSRHQDQCAPGL